MPISIAIADSQYLIRQGLYHLLDGNTEFEILAEAGSEEHLLAALQQNEIAVVILDYHQPDYFSPSTVKKIKSASPKTNVLIISSDDKRERIYKVLENGVNSFITKTCDEEEILDAVKATAKGEKFFCTAVINYIFEKSFGKEPDCSPTPLSLREIEIVRLVAKGMIAKEIANELNLSTHTIYTHRKNIMKKLQISSTSELVLYAVDQGFV